jgi:hypothetical protein
VPGNSRECREYAVRCAELAVQAKTDDLKAHFISLSKTWEGIAIELERAQSLIAKLDKEIQALPHKAASWSCSMTGRVLSLEELVEKTSQWNTER